MEWNKLAEPLYEAWYRGGEVDYFVSDPDGYLLRLYECIGQRSASG